MEPYLPALTAMFTLANTIVLLVMSRRQHRTHELVNGMRMQLVHEAEERGRRLERHASDPHELLGDDGIPPGQPTAEA